MSLDARHPSITQLPNHFGNARPGNLFSPSAHPPLRRPPQSHVRHQKPDQSANQSLVYHCSKREHSSFSSASTDSSYQSSFYPPPAPIHPFSHGPPLSGQCEPCSMEGPISSESCSGRRPRPFRSEMAEIRAIRRHCLEVVESQQGAEEHVIWILIWLSLLDPLYSLLAAAYTLLVLFPLLLTTPIRLCHPSFDLSGAIIRFIGPLLKQHLKFLRQSAMEADCYFDFKPICLVAVSLAAPLMSLGIAFAAWISAGFWIFAIVLGNPDGTEHKDDGKATILGVRNRWERILLSAVR